MLTKKDKNVATAEAIRLEARDKIRLLALPIQPGESVKAQWRKISRATGLTARRVRTLWYGQATTVHGHEIDIIRSLAETDSTIDRARQSNGDVLAELIALRDRLNHLLSSLGEDQHERA